MSQAMPRWHSYADPLELPARAIVVGADPSAAGRQALLWATDEGRRRRLPVVVCRAFPLPDDAAEQRGLDLVRAAAWNVARAGVDVVRREAPDVEAHVWVGPSTARQALLGAVERPEMYVVGASRRGRLAALLLQQPDAGAPGSATRPVVVVREAHPEPAVKRSLYAGHVVVGADGTRQSDAALAFAFATARARGLPLLAVHVGAIVPNEAWWDERTLELHEQAQTRDWMSLQDSVDPHRRAHPDVCVRMARYNQPVISGLLRAAAGADLLVLGTSGHGRIDGAVRGSVSRAISKLATCPVAVVPSNEPPPVDDWSVW